MKSNECGVCEREPQVTRAAAEVNGLACDVATQIERLVGRISPILSPTVPTPVAANGIAGREPETLPPLAEDLRGTGDILRSALRELERTIVRVEV
jgi:hypothetical protein